MANHNSLTTTSSTEVSATQTWRVPKFDRALDERGPLTQNGSLVPADYCRQVIAMPEDPACGPGTAAKLAGVLVGSYPQRRAADPKGYAYALTAAFSEFPEAVARAAIRELVLTKKFFPTAADVYEACGNLLGAERYRRTRAKEILAEHARRAAEEDRRQKVAQGRDRVAEKLAALTQELAGKLEMERGADD